VLLFTVDTPFNISQSYWPLPFSSTLPLIPLLLPVLFVSVTFDLFLYCFVHFVTASCRPLKPLKQSHNCIQHIQTLRSVPITVYSTFRHSALGPFTHPTISACYFPMDYLDFTLFCSKVFRNQCNEMAVATKGSWL